MASGAVADEPSARGTLLAIINPLEALPRAAGSCMAADAVFDALSRDGLGLPK
jgi:hypothetical protein